MNTATTLFLPAVEDVVSIAGDVWRCFVDRDGELEPRAPQPISGVGCVACVDIVGEWSRTITLAMRTTTAWTATMAMTNGSPTIEQVHDALGELVNMVGGNLKSLAPAPSRLQLPRVSLGRDLADLRSAETLMSVPLAWSGRDIDVLVTTFETSEADRAPDASHEKRATK